MQIEQDDVEYSGDGPFCWFLQIIYFNELLPVGSATLIDSAQRVLKTRLVY